MRKFLKDEFGINEKIIDFADSILKEIKPDFENISDLVRYNQIKVMAAFKNNKISDVHFNPTYGYGYNDEGREKIDAVYSEIFSAEDALVRHNIISGTHAISICLFGVLRPGDTLAYVTGKPYDTIEEVIGITNSGGGSLKDFGVNYIEMEANEILEKLPKNTKAVMIQKSKGYSWRPSLTNTEIEEIIKTVKSINKDIICIVDNCYGEFTEKTEPTYHGADLIAGSLIKNAGGGIAPTGGYVAGNKDLVELASYKLNSVGIGKHAGATLGLNKDFLQGIFFAPHVVGESLKTAVFCGHIFKKLGFEICPDITDKRGDIIQSIKFGTPEGVIKFCEGIQKGSPIDSFVDPVPWDMPGYQHQVIMAAGAFNQGSSIELSADGPIRPPYIAYMQGGLTFESSYIGILSAVSNLDKNGIINL